MKTPEPINTARKPKKPNPLLMPIQWAGALWYMLTSGGGRITKHDCRGLKPPYLLLSNHASMVDFAMAARATFPHPANWVISIEEFVGRDWLMRSIGGIYKRKFTSDIHVVKHILSILKRRKGICIMYPEARFSLAGVNERLSDAIGKLVKIAGCPVVVMIQHGNYICSPQWGKHPYRWNRVCADLTQIVTAREAKTLTPQEIQSRIEEAFVYDDYRWQAEQHIRTCCKKRARNLHRVLYQCPACEAEFAMDSRDSQIWCGRCGARWEMDVYGRLHRLDGEDRFTHVPDWYRWQRENVRAQVRQGLYRFEDSVRVEQLVNGKVGFRYVGDMKLTQDENGFTLAGKDAKGQDFFLNRPVSTMASCHIEYDFKKKGITRPGPALDLATQTQTYFVFPLTRGAELTKLHFAAEELFDYHRELGRK